MDAGMERLHSSPENLGCSGDLAHRGDGYPGGDQHLRGPSGRHQLHPGCGETPGQHLQPGLVGHREESPVHGDPAHGPSPSQ